MSELLSGADDFLVGGPRENEPSLSLRESDAAENDDRPVDDCFIGTLRALRSRICINNSSSVRLLDCFLGSFGLIFLANGFIKIK